MTGLSEIQVILFVSFTPVPIFLLDWAILNFGLKNTRTPLIRSCSYQWYFDTFVHCLIVVRWQFTKIRREELNVVNSGKLDRHLTAWRHVWFVLLPKTRLESCLTGVFCSPFAQRTHPRISIRTRMLQYVVLSKSMTCPKK